MDIQEMHGSILLRIDKMGSYSTANIIPGEIDDYINDAQREFINQNKMFLREYSNVPQAAEAHESLRTLEEEEAVNNVLAASDLDNGFRVNFSELSNDYDYFISGRAYFSTPDHWKPTKIVNRSYINDWSENLYHQSPVYSETPVVVDNENLIGLYGAEDTEVPETFVMNYLRKPQDVFLDPENSNNNVNSELPESVHRDIVDIAVNKIIRSLAGQQQGQQQKSQ